MASASFAGKWPYFLFCLLFFWQVFKTLICVCISYFKLVQYYYWPMVASEYPFLDLSGTYGTSLLRTFGSLLAQLIFTFTD